MQIFFLKKNAILFERRKYSIITSKIGMFQIIGE